MSYWDEQTCERKMLLKTIETFEEIKVQNEKDKSYFLARAKNEKGEYRFMMYDFAKDPVVIHISDYLPVSVIVPQSLKAENVKYLKPKRGKIKEEYLYEIDSPNEDIKNLHVIQKFDDGIMITILNIECQKQTLANGFDYFFRKSRETFKFKNLE
eukprot:UN31217